MLFSDQIGNPLHKKAIKSSILYINFITFFTTDEYIDL